VFEDEVAVGGRQAWPRWSSHGWTSTCVFAYLLATQAVALSKGRKSGGGAWEEKRGEARLGLASGRGFIEKGSCMGAVPSIHGQRG
jgi:hypothetical protein